MKTSSIIDKIVTMQRAAEPAADDADLGDENAKKPVFEGFLRSGLLVRLKNFVGYLNNTISALY